MYQAIIIGAGVSGCSVARYLSQYQGKFLVLEKGLEVCVGTSKANSGIVHAGYDAPMNSNKAKFNVLGNQMMADLAEQLGIPMVQNGSLVLCGKKTDYPILQDLYDKGIKNGAKGLHIIGQEEVRNMEPALNQPIYAALYASTAGIICPFHLTIALAENANVNGVEFGFQTEVKTIERIGEGYRLVTNKGEFETRVVVNAAGIYADLIHNQMSKNQLNIIPRRGSYYLLDHEVGTIVKRTIFCLPNELGKGVLIAPTIHGNLLVGPTAIPLPGERESVQTSWQELDEIRQKSLRMIQELPLHKVITTFAGLRAHEAGDDFIIGENKECQGFINVAGMESPGLASAPAVGKYVADLIRDRLHLPVNRNFHPNRQAIARFRDASLKEKATLIDRNPQYGTMICRCEQVTEAEVVEAIHRPLGAITLDGVKRRVRVGSGRCQGGFCTARLLDILARETGQSWLNIKKSGKGSNILDKNMLER